MACIGIYLHQILWKSQNCFISLKGHTCSKTSWCYSPKIPLTERKQSRNCHGIKCRLWTVVNIVRLSNQWTSNCYSRVNERMDTGRGRELRRPFPPFLYPHCMGCTRWKLARVGDSTLRGKYLSVLSLIPTIVNNLTNPTNKQITNASVWCWNMKVESPNFHIQTKPI
jgi:hypothetical protein